MPRRLRAPKRGTAEIRAYVQPMDDEFVLLIPADNAAHVSAHGGHHVYVSSIILERADIVAVYIHDCRLARGELIKRLGLRER